MAIFYGLEGIEMVEEVGSAIKNFKTGDKRIISCVSRCGTCENCLNNSIHTPKLRRLDHGI